MDELTDLRRQMDSLKKSLEQSQIINQELVRSVTKAKASWLNKIVKWEFILAPVVVLLILAECLGTGVSPWFAIVAGAGILIDSLYDLKTTRVPEQDIISLDLLSLREKLSRQKQMRYKQFLITTPLSLIWGAAFVYCIIRKILVEINLPENMIRNISIGTVLFTVVLCVVVVILIYRKMQKTGDEIISTIDELRSEE